MQNQNKGLLSLLGKIGDFFTKLFAGADHAWKKQSPIFQAAMIRGSGIIAIMNANVGLTPQFILDAIKKKFPDFTEDKIKSLLKQTGEGLAIGEGINSDDLLTMIEAFVAFLAKQKGTNWERISRTLALGIAVAIAPGETKFEAFASLIGYVYHAFIKHDV
jgi:hypothetical protein